MTSALTDYADETQSKEYPLFKAPVSGMLTGMGYRAQAITDTCLNQTKLSDSNILVKHPDQAFRSDEYNNLTVSK